MSWKQVVLTVILALGVGLLSGFIGGRLSNLVVKGIQLRGINFVDKEDNLRAVFQIDENGCPCLDLLDQADRTRAEIGLLGNGTPVLFFLDQIDVRAELVVPESGIPAFGFRDRYGELCVGFLLCSKDHPKLIFTDKSHNPRAMFMSCPDDVPRLILKDQHGDIVWNASCAD